MRPLELTMTNFGPYQHEVVDFTQFDDVPLFLISGKTGSGKTTIFDGMCYALFGKTSGDERKPEQMRSSFAQVDEKTMVIFEFEHQAKRYQITREPSYSYRNKKGGISTHQAKQLLEYQDVNGESANLTKKKDIETFIKGLLHLNVQQFTQIVLLPQQQFRKFLAADSTDKEEVLRQVFGTEIFQKWTNQIKNKVHELKKKHELQAGKLDTLVQTVQLPDEQQADIKTTQDWLDVVDRKIKQDQADLQHQKQVLTTQEQKLDEMRHQFDRQNKIADAYDQLDQLKKEQELLNKQKGSINATKEKIAHLEWAQQQQTLVADIKRQRQEFKDDSKNVDHLQAKLAQLKQVAVVEQQTHKELAAQADQMQELHQKEQQLRPKLEYYQKIEKAQQQLMTAKKEASQVEGKIAQLKKDGQTIDQQIVTNKEKLQSLGDLTARSLQIAQSKNHVDRLATILEKIKQTQVQHLNLKQKMAAVDHDVEIQAEKTTKAQQEAVKLNNYFARNQIQFYVKQLQEGLPCPVCGSLEHPQPAEIEVPVSMKDLTQEDVQQAQNQAVASAQYLSKLKERQENLACQISELKATFATTLAEFNHENHSELAFDEAVENLAAQKEKIQKDHDQLDKQIQLQKNLQNKTDYLEKRQTEMRQILTDQEQLQVQIKQKITMHQTEIKTQNALLPAEYATRKELESQLDQWQQAVESFAKKQQTNQQVINRNEQQQAEVNAQIHQLHERILQLKDRLKQDKNQLTEKLEQAEMNEAQLKTLLDKLNELEELSQQVESYQRKCEFNQTQITHNEKIIGESERPRIARLEEEIEQYEHQNKELQIEFGRNEMQLNGLKATYADALKLWQTYREDQHYLNEVTDLAEIISGGTSDKKLGFERFVLQEYFKEVLQVATQILERLTNGRYAFVLQENAERNTTRQTGLGIDVYDDEVGETRSVHTLSGGESFIAALALALALGEVIQRQNGGTEIDALFIDEGFGSLDDDSLSVAMETLRTLEGQNRMIGIISHVKELHSQIPDQINVISHEGQSHLRYRHEI